MRISDWSSDVCSSDLADGGSNHFDGTTNIARVDRLITASEEGAVRLCQNTVDWYFAHHAQSGRGSEHALVNGEIAAAINGPAHIGLAGSEPMQDDPRPIWTLLPKNGRATGRERRCQ